MAENNGRNMAKNTMWNAFEKFSQLGIQLLCTFVLARFLAPSDFGIVGMLVVFTQISRTIIDSGFTIALIREKEVTQVDLSSVFFLNFGLSIIVYGILYICSQYIAIFYHEPILNEVCKVTFLVIPILSLTLVQTALLHRSLQFKKISIIAFLSSVLASIIAVILAYWLRSVWALVIQNILMYAFQAILLWVTASWHPSLIFSWRAISKYFKFSKNLLITGLLGSFFNNINAILIGHYYTSSDLGFYSQANRVNGIASHTSTQVVQSVSYPLLARINNNGGDVKQGYKKVIMATVLFVGSIMAILMCISSDLFEILMGDVAWRQSGKFLFLLGLSGMLFPLHSVNQNILNVKGKSKTVLYLEIARRTILIVILSISLRFDVPVFVASYSFYSFVLLFLNLHYCGKPIQYSTIEQIRDVAPIFCRQFIVIAIGAVSNYFLSYMSTCWRMSITLSLSLICMYVLFYRTEIFREVITLISSIISRKKA